MATRSKAIHIDILESDHVNHDTSDELCSRCRNPVKEDEIPLRVWSHDGKDMWIYCPPCRDEVLGIT